MSAWILPGVAVLALVIAGVLYQSMGLARDARRFPPPGELLDVGGHRLHVVCRGHGAPAVVLESDIAASSSIWSRVQPEVGWPPPEDLPTAMMYPRAGSTWRRAFADRSPRSAYRLAGWLV